METITQAAIMCPPGLYANMLYSPKGLIVALPPPNRHHNIIRYICETFDVETVDSSYEQGFVTSTGRFVDRKEAVDIAVAAGQTTHHEWGPRTLLFSEDLW